MDTPLVSIIMGMFNNEKTIKRCIQSVIEQTYENWEFIICDDCSTDNSYNIVKQIANEDRRIKLIKNGTNQKLAASLNHCLERAKGKYIARMDGDDICLPQRLMIQVEYLEQNNDIQVVGSTAQVSDGAEIFEVRRVKENPSTADVLSGPPFIHPSIMMRKSAYDKLNGYTVLQRTIRGQDLDLWYRFFAEGMKGYNLQEPLIIYFEKRDDYKKRTFKTALMYTKTNLYGYKLLRVPVVKYPLAFKPIVSFLIPNWIIKSYHQSKK